MPRMVSGIKPTGRLTLGNYIGAIRNFKIYQDDYEFFLFIANLHAITVPQDPEELRRNIRDLAALYLACGIDPQKTTLFLQTDVLAHANLGFIMNCFTYLGELNRMTQFKDKSQKNGEEGLSVGLYTYPDLMAADILLYDPHFVPVGEDQKQHVELTRDLAMRFNNRFGPVFTVPEPYIPPLGARIMSLSDPEKKMSKSDDPAAGEKGVIYLLDTPAQARKKIMGAVTDSEAIVRYDRETKKGISNLIEILAVLENTTIESVEARFHDANYGTFKRAVADAVVTLLTDIQSRYQEILASGEAERVLEAGAKKAQQVAQVKLHLIFETLGLTPHF